MTDTEAKTDVIAGALAGPLLPCPFCGQEEEPVYGVELDYLESAGWRYATCRACNCAGPTAESESAAIAAWNVRAGQPRSEAVADNTGPTPEAEDAKAG